MSSGSRHRPEMGYMQFSGIILSEHKKKSTSKVNVALLLLNVNGALITNRKLRQRPCPAFVSRLGQVAFLCRPPERQNFALSTLQRVYDLRTHMPLVVTTTTMLFSYKICSAHYCYLTGSVILQLLQVVLNKHTLRSLGKFDMS